MNAPMIAAIVALVVGFGGGYFMSGNGTSVPTHVMPDGSSMANTMAGMTAGIEGKTGDDFDTAFLEEMIVHHEGAVAMAQLALERAQHSEIKSMAQDIIDTQRNEIATMRGWLQSWYGTPQ